MFSLFMPDYMFRSFTEVTPEFLASAEIKTVLADIDNTLAPYEMPDPDERIIAWANSLAAAGITLILVSNNHVDRVVRFARPLHVPAYYDAKKPSTKCYRHALMQYKKDIADAAVLGDQIFTDVFAGKRLGVKAILVPPIKDKKTLFFRFKRLLEKPVLRQFKREQVKKQFYT